MTDWLIKEEVYATLPPLLKRHLKEAIYQADMLGELVLGIVVIKDCEDEYVLMDKKDFEAWHE